jgi:hypothetical protein
MRSEFFGINTFLDIFLGSSPSFLYLFGLIALIPVIQPKISIKTFNKSVLMLTAGALVYEMEQYWTSMYFDFSDIFATVLAGLVMFAVHRVACKAI